MTSVCVIGSGAGGGLVALELLSRNKKTNVIIVDVDAIDQKHDQHRALDFHAESDTNLKNTYSKGAGGSTNKWHGVITKFDDHDISLMDKEYQFQPYEQIECYIDRLSHYFPNSDILNHEPSKISTAPLKETGKIREKGYLVYAFPLRVRKLLKRALKINSRLQYIGPSVCVGFEIQNNIISSALILSNGQLRKIFADKFILAAGAIENVRILAQTFQLPKETSRKFMDHPIVKIGQIQLSKRAIYSMNGTPGLLNRASRRTGFILSEPKNGSNHSLMLRPSASTLGKKQREIIRSIILNGFSWKDSIQLLKVPKLIPELFFLALEKFGIAIYTQSLDVTLQIQTTMADDLTVNVGPATVLGKQVNLTVKYKIPDRIHGEIEEIQRLIKETLQAGVHYIPEQNLCFYGGAHYSGTCPVNGDDELFSVNSDLSHKLLKNLSICDSSIFPVIGNSNLVYSIALQAIKLADRISD